MRFSSILRQMASELKQEMPPVGGYKPLCHDRIFPKQWFTVKKFLTATTICSAIWLYYFRKVKREIFMLEVEDRNDFIGQEPAMVAERDREFLRQMRKNRQEEEDLMKNFPMWETGTYFGEPIFKTIPDDFLIAPELYEYYIHTRLRYLVEYNGVDLVN